MLFLEQREMLCWGLREVFCWDQREVHCWDEREEREGGSGEAAPFPPRLRLIVVSRIAHSFFIAFEQFLPKLAQRAALRSRALSRAAHGR